MARPTLPRHLNRRTILLDDYAFRAEQRRRWIARVRHAADLNRDLSWDALAERFNCEWHQVERVCRDFPRELDLFAMMRNRENRRRRTA